MVGNRCYINDRKLIFQLRFFLQILLWSDFFPKQQLGSSHERFRCRYFVLGQRLSSDQVLLFHSACQIWDFKEGKILEMLHAVSSEIVSVVYLDYGKTVVTMISGFVTQLL